MSADKDLRAQLKALLDDPFPDAGLTPAEAEIARLTARGFQQPDMAKTLKISLPAVRKRLIGVRTKMKVSARDLPVLLIKKIEALLR